MSSMLGNLLRPARASSSNPSTSRPVGLRAQDLSHITQCTCRSEKSALTQWRVQGHCASRGPAPLHHALQVDRPVRVVIEDVEYVGAICLAELDASSCRLHLRRVRLQPQAHPLDADEHAAGARHSTAAKHVHVALHAWRCRGEGTRNHVREGVRATVPVSPRPSGQTPCRTSAGRGKQSPPRPPHPDDSQAPRQPQCTRDPRA